MKIIIINLFLFLITSCHWGWVFRGANSVVLE